jgi:hypothetical protein
MTHCPLFVELCAGTAALSLKLHAGQHARPPVSRMGAKTGYAHAILRTLGLRQGQGQADGTHFIFCEPDPGVRLMLHAYTDRELAQEAARIIRSWKDEEPRALWERLRAEGPARCPPVEPREVARWCWVQRRSAHGKGDGYHAGNETHKIGPESPAAVIEAATGLPATITDDARKVDPREVARWIQIVASNELINVDSVSWKNTGKGGSTFGGAIGYGADRSLRKMEALPTLPATITDDARAIRPAMLPPGTVAYIDPPYQDTTGYAHALPRSEWLPVVRAWAAAGATVCVSEAEPIPDLVAEGWHAVEITGTRKGQKRTFSRQTSEWLTLSREPSWRPSEQRSLFGAP